MRDASLSPADRVTVVGLVVLAIGVSLTWGIQMVGTLGLLHPWETTGFVPGRAVVLLPPLGYVAFRALRSAPTLQVAALAVSALVCVVYPPYRIRQAPLSEFVPSFGFVVVATAGLLFAGATALRYAEAAGFGSDESATEPPAEATDRP